MNRLKVDDTIEDLSHVSLMIFVDSQLIVIDRQEKGGGSKEEMDSDRED